MKKQISNRFRGFLPVVIDLETGGFNHEKHALLELAAVIINVDERGNLFRENTLHYHIKPFEGSLVDPESLKVTGIQPFHPLRPAKEESKALTEFYTAVRHQVKLKSCSKAIMVAHNSFFDLSFLKAATERCKITDSPFHSFSTFDTVTLGGLACGQTVLSRIAEHCGFDYDSKRAHGAKYDAELTADIFCQIANRWGFPQ